MKILILYSYNKGYLSSFFFELSVKLSESGHNVVNFSLKNDEKLFTKQGIDLIIKKKGGYATNYYHIFKTIKAIKPDVVLSNFSYVNPSLVFGKVFKVKKNMVWFHSLNNQMDPSFKNVFFKKLFLKLADIVIANSFLTKNELRLIYEIPEKKLRAIPFWSSISEVSPHKTVHNYSMDSNILNIGCPGRMVQHKNQKVVIEAIYKLKKSKSSDFRLYLAGEGEELANLKKLVYERNLEDKVSFLGHLSADEMISFYKNMDVIVLPSLHEAFGLVFIEAISMGVPVIVSSQFGALNFIDSTNYILKDFTFQPESVLDLEVKLTSYMNGKGHSRAFFKELYDKTFDKDLIYEQIKTILHS